MEQSEPNLVAQNSITVSVVIPCYDRMDLLERTVRACLQQKVQDATLEWEIVVADNHPQRLARNLVDRLQAEAPCSLRHVAAGERNIAQARNLGVAAAKGQFIAFVDDDEAPAPEWLEAHFLCLNATQADASFGPKYPVFAGGTAPEWDPSGRYYTTDFNLPQNTQLKPLQWFPPQARGLGTGNSMMRRTSCLYGDKPFDEAFGRCGGEDTLLLLTLAKKGRSFVWCANAKVWEYNEEPRKALSYMAQRVQRSSYHSAAVRMAISHNALSTRCSILAVGLIQLAVYGLLFLVRRNPSDYLQICKAKGKLGFGSMEFIPEPVA